MLVNTERSPAVNTDRLAIVPLIMDTGSTLVYSDTITEFDKGLISVQRTPKQNASVMYSSGQAYASYVAKSGGDISITSPALNSADETLLFGKSLDEDTGVISNNKDDIVPAVMVIYSTTTSSGKKNLRKVMKVKFAEGAENVETSDESGVKFQSVQISGTYEQLIKTGDDLCELKGIDPATEEGKAVISAWFGSALGGLPADKYGGTCTVTITGATGADYVTKGGVKIDSGTAVPIGTVLSIVLATAGTTCASGGTSLTNGQTLTVNGDTAITFTAA